MFTPPCAIAPAGTSSTKARPTNNSARANFAGEDGCRGPSFIHNHAKMGDKRITNAAWTDTNQDAYSLMPVYRFGQLAGDDRSEERTEVDAHVKDREAGVASFIPLVVQRSNKGRDVRLEQSGTDDDQ